MAAMKTAAHVVTVVRKQQKVAARLEEVSERVGKLQAELTRAVALEEQLTDELIALRNARR